MRTIDGATVATVVAVNPCCFEVAGDYAAGFVTHRSVFRVATYAVELICNRETLHEYACETHTPPPA